MESNYPRKIIAEFLKVNGKHIFARNYDSLEFSNFKPIEEYLVRGFELNKKSLIAVAKDNLSVDTLFLMNGFAVMFSPKLASLILHWLDRKLMVLRKSNSIDEGQLDALSNSIYADQTLSEAASIFGVKSNELRFLKSASDNGTELFSLIKRYDDIALVKSERLESYGTLQFIKLFPVILHAFVHGCTLVIDDFEASIHPEAVMSIVNIYHNDFCNKCNAQLIFNTHNPIFLNSSLFRGDEIKFVDRDESTHASYHYSISDFTADDVNDESRFEDYLKYYYMGRYGAYRDIDFSPVFDRFIEEG
jgi:AAA15 family ATPase/GTPase